MNPTRIVLAVLLLCSLAAPAVGGTPFHPSDDLAALGEAAEGVPSPVFVLWAAGDASVFDGGPDAWDRFLGRATASRDHATQVVLEGTTSWVPYAAIAWIVGDREVRLRDGRTGALAAPLAAGALPRGGVTAIAFDLEAYARVLGALPGPAADLPVVRTDVRTDARAATGAATALGTPTSHPGWPVDVPGNNNAAPIIADLDGDGSRDVIGGAETSGPESVFAWREDGTLLPGWPVDTGYTVRGFSSGDLDQDGKLEVVVISEDTKVWVFGRKGVVKPGWPQVTGGPIDRAASIGDLDDDGDLEVVAGSFDGHLYAWHHDGSLVAGFPIDLGLHWFSATPGLADVDGDGDLEIFYGGIAWFHAFHHDGSPVAGWPVSLSGGSSNSSDTSPAIGDLGNDGDLEIVLTTFDGRVFAWHDDGTTVTGFPVDLGAIAQRGPSLADLDGDADLEILQSARETKLLHALEHDGSERPGWPVPVDAQQYLNEVSAADLDGDGVVEVVTGFGYYSPPRHSDVTVFHPDGTTPAGWPIEVSGVIYGTPSLGDLDGDGQAEIAFPVTDTFGTSNPSRVEVWDVGGTFDPAAVEWATEGHDFRRTCLYGHPIYEDSDPSGCSTVGGPAGFTWIVLLPLALARRRRT